MILKNFNYDDYLSLFLVRLKNKFRKDFRQLFLNTEVFSPFIATVILVANREFLCQIRTFIIKQKQFYFGPISGQ